MVEGHMDYSWTRLVCKGLRIPDFRMTRLHFRGAGVEFFGGGFGLVPHEVCSKLTNVTLRSARD